MSAAEEFAECCAAQRWFVEEGWVTLQVAADNLQLLAETAGYVDEWGQDTVQRLMAEAFALAPIASLQVETDRPKLRTPQATVDAFKYVVSLGDADRLASWLRNHSEYARALLETLEAA